MQVICKATHITHSFERKIERLQLANVCERGLREKRDFSAYSIYNTDRLQNGMINPYHALPVVWRLMLLVRPGLKELKPAGGLTLTEIGRAHV